MFNLSYQSVARWGCSLAFMLKVIPSILCFNCLIECGWLLHGDPLVRRISVQTLFSLSIARLLSHLLLSVSESLTHSATSIIALRHCY